MIKGIRYPTMKQEDFASVVLDSEILRQKEIVSLVKYLNSVLKIPVGFPESKRSSFSGNIQRCCRFGSLSSYLSQYNEFRFDGINFSVDKDIELHGVCLFGSKNNTYSVRLMIRKETSGTVLESGTTSFNLDPSNVFSILPSAEKYEEKNLVDQCWKVIDKQTEEAVKSDGFATIERSLLEAVVKRDTVTIEEIELFKAVDSWATKQCEKQGLAADGATKRRILGEEVITGIRFPTMKQEDFGSVVLDSDILRKKEIVSLVKRFTSASEIPLGFPDTKRSGFGGDIQRCCRFGSLSTGNASQYDSKRKDAISFSVDKDTELRGVCLFGSENNTYQVDLEIEKNRRTNASGV